MRASFLLLASGAFLLACSGDDSVGPGPDGGDPDAVNGGDSPTNDGSTADTGPVLCGGKTCGANETCLNGVSCACNPGFVPGASGCDAAPAGSPASHLQADVCKKWKDGHVVTTPGGFTAGVAQCDLGTFAAGAITDTLVRINMFRWMEGIGDVADDPTKDANDQACALIQAWNNPSNFPNPHAPPASAVCYTATGATWSGQSNLAWGTSSPDAIDLYIEDPGAGNAGSLGHRRWVIHPTLGKVGIGFASGGNNGYGGRAQCLGVFDTSGAGPKPAWYAWPPPGYVPVEVTPGVLNQGWAWSFHLKQGGVVANAKITVQNLSTAADAPVTLKTLGNGYGDDAISFYPNGWTPAAGEVYRVTADVGAGGKFVYDVMPVSCK